MDEKQVNMNEKIDYVKPVILDLGEVTTACGAASCIPDGSSATGSCNTGTSAGDCGVSGLGAYACGAGTVPTGTSY